MRTPIALTLYVFLTAATFAQSPPSANEIAAAWTAAHEAGLASSGLRNYAAARVSLEQSWELARTPDERGVSAHDLGQIFRRLGQPREALQWLERAWDIWREGSQTHSGLVTAASSLSDLKRSGGDYTGAECLLRKTLQLLADDPPSEAVVRIRLAELLREEGSNGEARNLYAKAVQVESISWKVRLSAMIGLADIDRESGVWDSSAQRWNEVLEIARKQKDELAEAVGLRGLATVWLDSGNPARAAPLFRRSLRILENNPAAPPEQVATSLSGMGELYRSQDKLALAEDAWSRALLIERQELGEGHPQVACLMENLAEVYSARSEYKLAPEYSNRASEILAGSFGGDSLPAAAALTNRALVEQRANDLNAAAKDYERAAGIARSHPENRTLAAAVIHRYSLLLRTMHRTREARALDTEARAFH